MYALVWLLCSWSVARAQDISVAPDAGAAAPEPPLIVRLEPLRVAPEQLAGGPSDALELFVVIDSAGHYQTLSRLVDGAQQIEIGAEASPYALNPWDVEEPARVPREKVAFLLALHQLMMGRLDGRQLGMLATGIRAVYGKAAALEQRPTE